MYLLGHVGFSILALSLYNRARGEVTGRFRLWMIIGSMIPDLIDKPIGAIFFSRGRWFGHSVLVLTTLLMLTMVLFARGNAVRGGSVREADDRAVRSGSVREGEDGAIRAGSFREAEDGRGAVLVLYTGSLLHLVEDFGIGLEVVLWPLLGPIDPVDVSGFLMGIFNPYTVMTEFLGLLIILLHAWGEHWDRRWVGLTALAILAYVLTYVTAYVVIVVVLQL